ncbi:MAG: hypothetical protein GYA57_06905, partial [Myxococcales bacterium]|nr:hypothetical protein [Myxococcales bacterium]
NHLSSIGIVLDADLGTPLRHFSQLPYGAEEKVVAPVGWEAKDVGRYEFTGKERDRGVGLAYFGIRHYLAPIGRWTAPDLLVVLGAVATSSPFRFSDASPTGRVDPDGLDATLVIDGRDYLPDRLANGAASAMAERLNEAFAAAYRLLQAAAAAANAEDPLGPQRQARSDHAYRASLPTSRESVNAAIELYAQTSVLEGHGKLTRVIAHGHGSPYHLWGIGEGSGFVGTTPIPNSYQHKPTDAPTLPSPASNSSIGPNPEFIFLTCDAGRVDLANSGLLALAAANEEWTFYAPIARGRWSQAAGEGGAYVDFRYNPEAFGFGRKYGLSISTDDALGDDLLRRWSERPDVVMPFARVKGTDVSFVEPIFGSNGEWLGAREIEGATTPAEALDALLSRPASESGR